MKTLEQILVDISKEHRREAARKELFRLAKELGYAEPKLNA